MRSAFPFAMAFAFAASIIPSIALAQKAADPSIPAFVRTIGDAVSRKPVGPDGEQADKLLAFQLENGELVITAMVTLPTNDTSRPALGTEILGVIRTRATNRAEAIQPDLIDVGFAKAGTTPVYIVGEWNKPAVIWEIVPDGDAMMWRVIDDAGLTGPWQQLILP